MEHYFSKNPKSKLKEYTFNVDIKGVTLKIISASSIFSHNRLDKATKLLIENSKLPEKGDVLDLGCGYGVIGLFIKKFNPNLNVYLIDINERAIDYAKKNAKLNKLEIRVIQSDLFSNLKSKLFDVILLNPPISAGRDICKKMIQESFNHLRRGGSLQLVAYHNKGGKLLGGYMKEIFGNLSFLVKKGGIRVYFSKKL